MRPGAGRTPLNRRRATRVGANAIESCSSLNPPQGTEDIPC
jgi:hypothetical protein